MVLSILTLYIKCCIFTFLNVCYMCHPSDLLMLIRPIKSDEEVFKSEVYTVDIKVLRC